MIDMKKHRDLCSWISDNWIGILLFLISITIMAIPYYNKIIELSVILINISYSILAAFLFYLIIDVIPTRKRTKIIRNRITRQFVRVKEEIRLCKSVLSPFDLDKYDSLNRNEYVAEFETLDLNTKYISKNGIIIKDYLENHKHKIEFILNQILEYNQYLNNTELNLINDILNSTFLLYNIRPINYDLPNELICTYPNNQRGIGESIYDISELIKQV